MRTATDPTGHRTPLARAILLGALAVGVLDGLDAVVFFGLRGASPARVFQGIASALLGPQAFRLGARGAALGLAIHFCVATAVVALYVAASRRLPVLARRVVLGGVVYGIGAFCFMRWGVLPLTLVRTGPLTLPALLNGLFAHALLVGLPSALAARAAAPPAATDRAV